MQAARLQRIMVPLIRVMDHPMPLDQVKVGIMESGGFFATHPGTADRIDAVRKMP